MGLCGQKVLVNLWTPQPGSTLGMGWGEDTCSSWVSAWWPGVSLREALQKWRWLQPRLCKGSGTGPPATWAPSVWEFVPLSLLGISCHFTACATSTSSCSKYANHTEDLPTCQDLMEFNIISSFSFWTQNQLVFIFTYHSRLQHSDCWAKKMDFENWHQCCLNWSVKEGETARF